MRSEHALTFLALIVGVALVFPGGFILWAVSLIILFIVLRTGFSAWRDYRFLRWFHHLTSGSIADICGTRYVKKNGYWEHPESGVLLDDEEMLDVGRVSGFASYRLPPLPSGAIIRHDRPESA